MMPMLRRCEIGAAFSTNTYQCQGRGMGLRSVSLGICDYFISTGKQPLEVACITNIVMSSLLNYSVGLGAVRQMLYDCCLIW